MAKKDPGLDVGAWQRTVPAVAEGSQVSLRRLPPLVVTEVFYGLQQRTGRTSRRATCTSGPSATCCASRGSLRDRAGPGESEPTPDGPGEVLRQVGAAAGHALTNLGIALQGAERFEEAITACQDAAAIYRDTGDRHGEADALTNLGIALHGAERFEEAITACQDAAAIYRDTGDQHNESVALANLEAARAVHRA